MKKKMHRFMMKLERHVLSPAYPLWLGGIAFIDNFIFLIPIAALLLTSVAAAPKRWFNLAFWTTLGNALGAILFAFVIEHYGLSLVDHLAPKLVHSHEWTRAASWVSEYGVWALFGVCALPISEHVVIILAVLARIAVTEISIAIFAGKLIKFFLLSWLASHAPRLLMKVKWIQKDVEEVQSGIKPKR